MKTDICPGKFHGELCKKQNLLIKEQAPMGVSSGGGRERIPPPMEFESDDVIHGHREGRVGTCSPWYLKNMTYDVIWCSPSKCPKIFARACALKGVKSCKNVWRGVNIVKRCEECEKLQKVVKRCKRRKKMQKAWNVLNGVEMCEKVLMLWKVAKSVEWC